MKSVLISIRPQWCKLIEIGKKTIEVRKTRPKIETPFKCYIYCTLDGGVKGDRLMIDGKVSKVVCGMVIGEFVCDNVEVLFDTNGNPKNYMTGILPSILQKTALSYDEFGAYVGSRADKNSIYGWHISDLKIYEKPRELSEFYKTCPDKYHYCEICKHGSIILPPDEEEYAMYHGGNYENYETICHNRVTRPPQSWCYVEELQNV